MSCDSSVDHTRVILAGVDPDVVGADYVNANYVSGEVPGSERRYIATQVHLSGHVTCHVMSCDCRVVCLGLWLTSGRWYGRRTAALSSTQLMKWREEK